METQEKLAVIRQACIAANPTIVERFHPYGGENAQIRLADVLLAIGKTVGIAVDSTGMFLYCDLDKIEERWALVGDEKWNLRNDDLAAQSSETLDFLYDLLKANPT